MSEGDYHALIATHYQRSISAAAASIGEKAGRSVYITSEYTLMDLLSIIPYARASGISKTSASSTFVSISTGVI